MNEMPKAHTFNKTIRHIPTSIINADREEHSRFRRALSHGFSDSAMRDQEPMIAKYVDLLIAVSIHPQHPRKSIRLISASC